LIDEHTAKIFYKLYQSGMGLEWILISNRWSYFQVRVTI